MFPSFPWLSVFPAIAPIFFAAMNAQAESSLVVAYPPRSHETTAQRIFIIGTAPPQGDVTINGQAIARTAQGHFAPSLPLQVGENRLTVRYGDQTVELQVKRLSTLPTPPTGTTFSPGSLQPAVDIARSPNEPICFAAIAPAGSQVEVRLAQQTIPLVAAASTIQLPDNLSVLTMQNQPQAIAIGSYRGCTRWRAIGNLGKPEFRLTLNGQTTTQMGSGTVEILSPTQWQTAIVTVDSGTARTGPGTDYSRLTPLPKGTQAAMTGREGDWLRLDYGGWIRRREVEIRPDAEPPTTLIRSVRGRSRSGWTEIRFPLQVPVPVRVQQGDRSFSLTLYNTTAQTDIIKLDDDPLIERLDWQQVQPSQVQYTFQLKSPQQWGYRLHYDGTTLVLGLRHPPRLSASRQLPLQGITILLDPGHGGPADSGAVAPTGLTEKTFTLAISQRLQRELQQRGATVVMTRDRDVDVSLSDRVTKIEQGQPTLALSLHYNALPDDGDALKTQGISTFWYHAQAHSLAVFLHNHLVKTLHRPSYGVFWNNLALTRPAIAPSVLLELGFLINPTEYEWIADEQQQAKLARAIADGITAWFKQTRPLNPVSQPRTYPES